MIEAHYLELLELSGWVKQYWQMLPDYGTMEATYEALERKYERAFGKRKYSDFDSFRQGFYRYQRNQNNRKNR